MRRSLWTTCILTAILVILAIVWWRKDNPPATTGGKPSPGGGTHASVHEIHRTGPERKESPPPAHLIAEIHRSLAAGTARSDDIRTFRSALLRSPARETIAAIKDFLASGNDTATGESFEIGPRGELTGAPTLRVLLLDLLGRITRDASLPDAGVLARSLMETKTTADEWALALRNAAWAAPDDHAYLAARTREMLAYDPWRNNPSAGFREAFDTIVYTKDAGFLPVLGPMLSGGAKSLRFTAATTVDRLAAAAPLETMVLLNSSPALLADKPFLRADCFAKADLAVPAQKTEVETYLSRADVASPAKEKLIAGLGIQTDFVSNNLLTAPPPSSDPSRSSAEAVKSTLAGWLASDRFPALSTAIHERLAGF